MGLLLPEIDADAGRLPYRDHDRLPALAEIRMSEHDFMSANAFRQVSNWRFTSALAIDPHLGPGLRVDAQHTVRQIQFRGGGLSSGDVNGAMDVEPKRLVREFDVVIPSGPHQSFRLAGPDHLSAFTKLQSDWRGDRDPPG